jgi:hypothetical protein
MRIRVKLPEPRRVDVESVADMQSEHDQSPSWRHARKIWWAGRSFPLAIEICWDDVNRHMGCRHWRLERRIGGSPKKTWKVGDERIGKCYASSIDLFASAVPDLRRKQSTDGRGPVGILGRVPGAIRTRPLGRGSMALGEPTARIFRPCWPAQAEGDTSGRLVRQKTPLNGVSDPLRPARRPFLPLRVGSEISANQCPATHTRLLRMPHLASQRNRDLERSAPGQPNHMDGLDWSWSRSWPKASKT